jgi:hypothetical protein
MCFAILVDEADHDPLVCKLKLKLNLALFYPPHQRNWAPLLYPDETQSESMKPKESQWYALIQCDAKHQRSLDYTRMQALQFSSKHAMPNQERIRGTWGKTINLSRKCMKNIHNEHKSCTKGSNQGSPCCICLTCPFPSPGKFAGLRLQQRQTRWHGFGVHW